ncbi:hypothetical protein [Chryseobacterium herbae]|uniref:DUF3108 domain-containing protein n=1 Tax=Chryseobacterium herbae TaxID=2976476 RepID=A0ABT2ITG5_9FLAO|nr:hypothetical protein [Chryseobacterium sp. pc1-10]MCT2562119.1 hypothetical protein [Chryseobacterium sp. pc1-10]
MKYKKTVILTSLLVLIGLFFVLKKQYNQYVWRKTIVTPEHKLKVGSIIFSKELRVDGGSQWYKMNYSLFKVIRIKGDFVRIAPIDKLYTSRDLSADNDLPPAAEYEYMKNNIGRTIVTGILREDLYANGAPPFILTADLKKKYPSLFKSRYYYEELSEKDKNTSIPKNKITDIENWLGLTYSVKQIVEHGVLVPYTLTDNFENYSLLPYLADGYDIKIDLIINSRNPTNH